MPEQRTATIIAFPGAKAADEPRLRLQRALASLEQALAGQRDAVAAWRDSLGQLHGSVRGLGASLGAYQARLGGLADDVDGLNRQARRMETWADGVLARETAAP